MMKRNTRQKPYYKLGYKSPREFEKECCELQGERAIDLLYVFRK